jgi:hypothetical protein
MMKQQCSTTGRPNLIQFGTTVRTRTAASMLFLTFLSQTRPCRPLYEYTRNRMGRINWKSYLISSIFKRHADNKAWTSRVYNALSCWGNSRSDLSAGKVGPTRSISVDSSFNNSTVVSRQAKQSILLNLPVYSIMATPRTSSLWEDCKVDITFVIATNAVFNIRTRSSVSPSVFIKYRYASFLQTLLTNDGPARRRRRMLDRVWTYS